MQRFSKILALRGPGAQGESALRSAARVALSHKARLTVLSVLEEFPPKMLSQNPAIAALWNEVVNEVSSKLQTDVSALREQGLDADAKVANGTPFIEVIREVMRGGYDLVMKDSESRGRLKSMFSLGSNDMHLLRKCPCPVWVVRPSRRVKFTRILAAVDPDPFNEERDGLNLKIMELAVSIARSENAKLIIVHAWGLASENLMRARSLVSETDIEAYLNETHAMHRKRLKELISRFDLTGIEYETHLLKGEAWKIIPELEKATKADLVVMGTVGRTGLQGLVMGNTAEGILNAISCSVLAVKPEGFVSPVTL